MGRFLATTALVALFAATPGVAQTTPRAEPPATPPQTVTSAADETKEEAGEAQPAGLDGDILVTARRREESIIDVPGTINAISAEQLQAKGPVTGGTDLLAGIPGVRFNTVAAENLSEVSIRGSGTQRATGADSGVGLFVNGAYVGSQTLGGRNFKTLDYFDIDRVEVLEGPQGALYGRNSEFGTVNLVLARPRFDSSGYVQGTYTFGLHQGRIAAVVNEALSDTDAVRIGTEVYGQSKGFYYDPNNNEYYDKTSGWLGRAQGRHRSGDLDVTVLVEAQDLKLPSFVNSFNVAPGTVAALPLGFFQDRFVIPHEGRDGLQQDMTRAMVLASYDLGFAKLESTTMASRWRSQQQFAGAIDFATLVTLRQQNQLGAYPYGQTTTDVNDRTFYQDLHLTGTSDNDRLVWVVGGELLRQRDFYTRRVNTSPCAFTAVNQSVCTGTPATPICLRPLATSVICPTVFPLAFGTDTRTRQAINSVAAYASLQLNAGNFAFTGEGRVTHDEKRVVETQYRLYTTTLGKPVATNRFEKTQPAWTITAAYKFTGRAETLVYAKIGTGYRAGGVNLGTFNAAAPNPFQETYGNEDTISYEAGIKSNVTRNIFLRLSGYLSRTHDAITSIIDGCAVTNACGTGPQAFNTNAGTIHAKGLEASAEGRFPVGRGGLLTLNLSAGTQDARFASLPSGRTGLPVLDSEVAQIPDWTYGATIDVRHPIAEGVTGFANVNYNAQRGGAQDTTTLATPRIDLEDFDVFGARAGINVGARYQLAAFVKNFTDQDIRVLKFNSGVFPLSARHNQPRTYGVTGTYRW